MKGLSAHYILFFLMSATTVALDVGRFNSAEAPMLIGAENSTDAELRQDLSVARRTHWFCKGFLPVYATKGIPMMKCMKRLHFYGPCKSIGVGWQGRALLCSGPAGPVIIKTRLAILPRSDDPNSKDFVDPVASVLSAAYEAYIGCLITALRLDGVVDIFSDTVDFCTCSGEEGHAFLQRSLIDQRLSSGEDLSQEQAWLDAAKGSTWPQAFLVTRPVHLPYEWTGEGPRDVTPGTVFEMFYAFIALNTVANVMMVDTKPNHNGMRNVSFWRHYSVLGDEILLPPGNMAKLIDYSDFFNHRGWEFIKPHDIAWLWLAYRTLWGIAKQNVLQPRAIELYDWSCNDELAAMPLHQAMTTFTRHFLENFPEYAYDAAKVQGLTNVRHYRLPIGPEADRIRAKYTDGGRVFRERPLLNANHEPIQFPKANSTNVR